MRDITNVDYNMFKGHGMYAHINKTIYLNPYYKFSSYLSIPESGLEVEKISLQILGKDIVLFRIIHTVMEEFYYQPFVRIYDKQTDELGAYFPAVGYSNYPYTVEGDLNNNTVIGIADTPFNQERHGGEYGNLSYVSRMIFKKLNNMKF